MAQITTAQVREIVRKAGALDDLLWQEGSLHRSIIEPGNPPKLTEEQYREVLRSLGVALQGIGAAIEGMAQCAEITDIEPRRKTA